MAPKMINGGLLNLLIALGFLLGFYQPVAAGPKPDQNAYTLTYTIIKDYSVAGSGNPDIIQFSVTPVPNPAIQLTFNISSSSYTPILWTDPTTGQATLYFSSSIIGPVTVDVLNGGVSLGSVIVNFIAAPGPPDLSKSYIQAVQPTNPADGTSADVVQAVLYDQYGNPCASGTAVNFSLLSGVANMSPASGATTSTGNVAVGNFTSTTPGTVNVQAQVFVGGTWQYLKDQSQANNYVPVQFTVPPPSIAQSYIVAVIPSTAADGTSKDEVDAVVNNSLGNPVPDGTVVTFTIQSGTATMTATGVTTGGVAKAFFTSTVPGSVNVQAQVSIAGVPTYLNDQTTGNNFSTVVFTVPPPSIALSYITGITTTTAADGTSQDEVDAVVNNSLGPVPDGTVVSFTIKSGTATIIATGVTSGGVAKAYFTSTVVGSVDVQAQVSTGYLNDKITGNNYTTIQFTVPPPVAAQSYIVGITTSTLADGTSRDEVDAVVNSAVGPVPDGTQVTFTIKSGSATIIATGVTAGGVAKAYFTSTVVGSVQVQAQVSIGGVPTYLNDQAIPANNYVNVQFVVGTAVPGDPGGGGSGGTNPGNGGVPPGSGNGGGTGGPGSNPGGGNGNNSGPGDNNGFTLLFVRQDYRLGDGTEQDSVIAYITDAYKHPIKGEHVKFFIQVAPLAEGTATATAQFTISALDVVTDDQGMARIALTSTKPGTVYVSAILLSQNVLIDGSYQIVTFTNRPDVNNPETRLSVVIYEALADGSQQTAVKAHIVDLDGNVMPGVYVKFKVDSGSADIVGGVDSVLTDANGDATIYFTSKTPGKANITATVEGLQIINGSPARVKFAMINIYVPKVFTPNNDGTNDLLKPILVGIQTFHYFSVYNRWGNLIYTTQDPNRGWDGTFKGVAQPVETYLWMAEGIDVEGNRVLAKGMTSLVR
ncbi:MAG: Ig-like domain-containing protein [Bacteroidetes bacterium]|nr:Ig-like domain-containing protein [Bacteroidota bacterium]